MVEQLQQENIGGINNVVLGAMDYLVNKMKSIAELRSSIGSRALGIALAGLLALNLALSACTTHTLSSTDPVLATRIAIVDPYVKGTDDFLNSESSTYALEEIEKSAPNIWASSFYLRFVDDLGNDFGECSGVGFNIDGSNYVVTADHCTDGYDLPITRIRLSQPHNAFATPFDVDVFSQNTVWNSDILIFRVNSSNPLPVISVNESSFLPDQISVTSLTFPQGRALPLLNAPAEHLAAEKAVQLGVQGGPEEWLVRVNYLSPGCSGGGVFDRDGKLIGIVRSVVDPTEGETGFLFYPLPNLTQAANLP